MEFQPAADAPMDSSAAEFALRGTDDLAIQSWQGARNCGDSFDITLRGVTEDEPVSFSTNNCTVFPQTGNGNGVYTVTVTGAGS